MTIAFKSWLPEEALRGGTVERSIRDAAHIWSERWFARQFVRLLETAGHPAGRPRDLGASWTCHTHAEGLSIAFTDTSSLALAGLMLDRSIESGTLNLADKALLDRLAAACVGDLCELVSDRFGLSRDEWHRSTHIPAAQQEAHFYRLGLGAGTPLLHIGVDNSAAVALIRQSARPAEGASSLCSMQAALKPLNVQISARLGECKISLADLAQLAVGDVLVLDRDITSAAEIAIDGKSTAGCCAVEPSAGKLRLKILKSVTG